MIKSEQNTYPLIVHSAKRAQWIAKLTGVDPSFSGKFNAFDMDCGLLSGGQFHHCTENIISTAQGAGAAAMAKTEGLKLKGIYGTGLHHFRAASSKSPRVAFAARTACAAGG